MTPVSALPTRSGGEPSPQSSRKAEQRTGHNHGVTAKVAQSRSSLRRWIRIAFLVWATVSTAWLWNSYRTQGVGPELTAGDNSVSVESSPETLGFFPPFEQTPIGLLFFSGAGVAAEAYAPLLRPIAASGFPVVVVRLPYRIAPLERHKVEAIRRARAAMEARRVVRSWVVAGHSLGGALAARLVHEGQQGQDGRPAVAALVLIATSHPKTFDLSQSSVPVTKIYASNDGIATKATIDETKALLPLNTRWVQIQGGNHSQFAHYGHQLFDGTATISRDEQQDITRNVLRDVLRIARRGSVRE